MKIRYIGLLFIALWGINSCSIANKKQKEAKTIFQTSARYSPYIDARADAVVIYSVGTTPKSDSNSFENRLKSWKNKGYIIDFMTGIAWGDYGDYFSGKWDGKSHLDEGQKDENGNIIWHNPGVPYIVPTENYLNYFKQTQLKRVIDAGITSIYLEEPEFWARAGYSEAFKKEWKKYYGYDWEDQRNSPEAAYLANKLKYYLYYRALNEAFTYAKQYGKTKGLDVKCYVPTHSLLNYSMWSIVSPEASLASMKNCDGYIAQAWTGTARTPNYYQGKYKERVFETAYLEYGCMQSMTYPTGRKVWFLTDPIEDCPRDWQDYKKNYQATFTAQLLYPQISDYEIMPWPERIYTGYFQTSATDKTKIKIPHFYSTMMQIMVNALQNMPKSINKVDGSRGISVLMGNSLMFQRYPINKSYSDPQLSDFFGLVFPLLKRGVPVGITHIENLGLPKSLEGTKVLLMTYSNMKPMGDLPHKYLAEWVKKGGCLIYSGTDTDPFQVTKEWWNTGKYKLLTPSEDLFQNMGLGRNPKQGIYVYGKGHIAIIRCEPKDYVMKDNGERYLDLVNTMYKFSGSKQGLAYKNYFTLDRGRYKLIAVLDESVSAKPYSVKGLFVDLYSADLPIVTYKEIKPGEQDLLLDINKVKDCPSILAAASRAYDVKKGNGYFSYIAKAPANTINVARIYLPKKPKSVIIDGKESYKITDWNELSKTYLIKFENNPDGVGVKISW